MENEIPLKLFSFLSEHKAQDAFLKNYNEQYRELEDVEENYIINAFDWSKTKEGFDYWGDLSYKWLCYCRGWEI